MKVERGLVLKIGGSLEGESLGAVVSTVKSALVKRQPVMLVHGGGPRITRSLQALGIELPFIQGHRLTTPQAVTIIAQVLAQINEEITTVLSRNNLPAVSVSIADAVLEADPLPGLERTARVKSVKQKVLEAWTNAGKVPVLAPIGVKNDLLFNMNADLAAAAVAGASQVERLIFLTDVPGIYEDFEAKLLLREANYQRLTQLLEDGRFHAGMIPKVEAVLAALSAGVSAAYVVDGRDSAAVNWAAKSLQETEQTNLRPLGTRVVREEVYQ